MAEKQNPTRQDESIARRVFDDFGLGGWLMPRFGRDWFTSPLFSRGAEGSLWSPEVEVFQRGEELVIRADLPGLNKDDVKVDVKDDGLLIQGERRREYKEEREGIYRSERTYGSFQRWIPLPDGAMTDQAKAKFKNGVLEVVMPAPPAHLSRGRRIEITDEAGSKK